MELHCSSKKHFLDPRIFFLTKTEALSVTVDMSGFWQNDPCKGLLQLKALGNLNIQVGASSHVCVNVQRKVCWNSKTFAVQPVFYRSEEGGSQIVRGLSQSHICLHAVTMSAANWCSGIWRSTVLLFKNKACWWTIWGSFCGSSVD